MAFVDVNTSEEAVHAAADDVLAKGDVRTATLLRALLWRAQTAEHRLRVSREIEAGSDGFAIVMHREAGEAMAERDALRERVAGDLSREVALSVYWFVGLIKGLRPDDDALLKDVMARQAQAEQLLAARRAPAPSEGGAEHG